MCTITETVIYIRYTVGSLKCKMRNEALCRLVLVVSGRWEIVANTEKIVRNEMNIVKSVL